MNSEIIRTIDFDQNDWLPDLDATLGDLIPHNVKAILRKTQFEYREEALNSLAQNSPDVDAIIDRTLDIRDASSNVRLFHGTRLTDKEVESLRQNGLTLLDMVEAHRLAHASGS